MLVNYFCPIRIVVLIILYCYSDRHNEKRDLTKYQLQEQEKS